MSASRPAADTDEDLVLAARRGEVRALERLLDRHQGRVIRTLRLLGIPPDDREDVAQEVMIRVFRHLDGYRPGNPFTGWLYRVTVNSAHDYRRRRGRRGRAEAPWNEALETTADSGPGPSETVTAREDLRRTLEAALTVLSDRERAVFVLREMEDLDTGEVARALGISTITVRRHLGLARKHLRKALLSRGG